MLVFDLKIKIIVFEGFYCFFKKVIRRLSNKEKPTSIILDLGKTTDPRLKPIYKAVKRPQINSVTQTLKKITDDIDQIATVHQLRQFQQREAFISGVQQFIAR
jgi:hypothetical protein